MPSPELSFAHHCSRAAFMILSSALLMKVCAHAFTCTCVHSLYSENKLGLTAQYIDRIHLDEYNLPVFPNSRFRVWLADKVQMEIFLDSDQEEEKGWERLAPRPVVALSKPNLD